MTVSFKPLNFLELEEIYKISWVAEMTNTLELGFFEVHNYYHYFFIVLINSLFFASYYILGSLCVCLFAPHSHSADRYVSDGELDSSCKTRREIIFDISVQLIQYHNLHWHFRKYYYPVRFTT